MCGVTALLGIASAGFQFMGQVQAANAQNEAANQNIVNSRAAYNRELVDNNRNYIARATENQQKGFDATLEGRDKMGVAIANAADSGTMGGSINAVRNSLIAQASENSFRIQSGFDQARRIATNENDSAWARSKDRINSMPYAAGPNPLGLAINAATAVFA